MYVFPKHSIINKWYRFVNYGLCKNKWFSHKIILWFIWLVFHVFFYGLKSWFLCFLYGWNVTRPPGRGDGAGDRTPRGTGDLRHGRPPPPPPVLLHYWWVQNLVHEIFFKFWYKASSCLIADMFRPSETLGRTKW